MRDQYGKEIEVGDWIMFHRTDGKPNNVVKNYGNVVYKKMFLRLLALRRVETLTNLGPEPWNK